MLIYVFLLGIVCILSYIRILERLVKKTHNFKYQLVEGALGRAGRCKKCGKSVIFLRPFYILCTALQEMQKFTPLSDSVINYLYELLASWSSFLVLVPEIVYTIKTISSVIPCFFTYQRFIQKG